MDILSLAAWEGDNSNFNEHIFAIAFEISATIHELIRLYANTGLLYREYSLIILICFFITYFSQEKKAALLTIHRSVKTN